MKLGIVKFCQIGLPEDSDSQVVLNKFCEIQKFVVVATAMVMFASLDPVLIMCRSAAACWCSFHRNGTLLDKVSLLQNVDLASNKSKEQIRTKSKVSEI